MTYRWTHDDSRECIVLASTIEPHTGRFPVRYPEDIFVGGSYQVGVGEWLEVVHLDVAHSQPPLFRVLRGLWGTNVRAHSLGTPLIPVRRLYLEF